MTRIDFELAPDLAQFVDQQVATGRFDAPAAYIKSLLKRAKQGNERLESLLIEGLDSGDTIPLNQQEWERIREDVAERLSDGK